MSSEDVNKKLALDQLTDWNDKCVPLLFTFTEPGSKFAITVELKGFDDESIGFEWKFLRADTEGSFITTNAYFAVWLKAASLSVSDTPEPSVTISRGEFRVVLTVLHLAVFGV